MRLFIAGNLPAAIRDVVHADAVTLRAAAPAIKWVAAPALHVTLKFLGEMNETQIGALTTALQLVAGRHAPIDVRLTGIGAFPNFRRPRVVWVGMTGAEALSALARDVDVAVAGFGVPIETRPFRAHLTLGRVRREMTPIEAAALEAAAQARGPAHEFSIRAIDLMQSELGPGGSRYSVLAAVPLHARGT